MDIFKKLIMVCTHLRCYITSDVHLIMCALCEKKQLKDLLNQRKKKKNSQCFFLCIYFLIKKYFDMCFANLIEILCITSLLYNKNHMITNHLYIYEHV
jgi:hypothetical protein